MAVYWGVNLSHDGSICQLKENGEIDWFSEEERFSRQKNHEMPMSIVPFIKYDDEIKPIQVSGLYEHWDKRKFEEDAFYFFLWLKNSITNIEILNKIFIMNYILIIIYIMQRVDFIIRDLIVQHY